MTNAELIAKIKAEIERRKLLLTQHSKLTYDLILETFIKEYDDLLSFLSTLESEKPMNPDDAMKALDEKIALVKRRGTWDGVDVDKYMDEVRGREPEKQMNQDEDLNDEIKKFIEEYGYERGNDKLLIAIVARHFTDWQNEQMMKEAVEGEIQKRYSGSLCAKTIRAINEDKFKFGDKVRVILIKEDEK